MRGGWVLRVTTPGGVITVPLGDDEAEARAKAPAEADRVRGIVRPEWAESLATDVLVR